MADVRDVAQAHLAAAFKPNAKGKRFIVSSPTHVTRHMVLAAVNRVLPHMMIADPSELGESSAVVSPATASATPLFCSKNFDLLGIQLLRPDTSLREMAVTMQGLEGIKPITRRQAAKNAAKKLINKEF
jgi:nucleoside-diphosphate-sugar epimerase